MNASELLRRDAIPFAVGAGTGAFLLFWAPQDQMGVANALAPIAAITAFFTPGGAAYALPVAMNGLAYVAAAGAIRSNWVTRRWLSVVLVALLALWVGSVLASQVSAHQLHSYTEAVLSPGMKLTAMTPNGMLTVLAGDGTRRTYRGDGWGKSISLMARKSRWHGSLGLYDPAESYSPYGRVLVEEGRQHFSTEAAAAGWLQARSREAGVGKETLVFTNDGLVLRYSVRLVPGSAVPTAQVDLWQLYVNGHRPHGLPGADDGAIRIDGGAVAGASVPRSR